MRYVMYLLAIIDFAFAALMGYDAITHFIGGNVGYGFLNAAIGLMDLVVGLWIVSINRRAVRY
jgi:hypothetical protein